MATALNVYVPEVELAVMVNVVVPGYVNAVPIALPLVTSYGCTLKLPLPPVIPTVYVTDWPMRGVAFEGVSVIVTAGFTNTDTADELKLYPVAVSIATTLYEYGPVPGGTANVQVFATVAEQFVTAVFVPVL